MRKAVEVLRGFTGLMLGLVLSVVQGPRAWAGVVSLETQVAVEVKEGVALATISVTNKGDEAAYNVQITTEGPGGFSWSAPARDQLPVQGPHGVTCEQDVKALLPGRYPLIVRTLYADANGYPFSAVALHLFAVGQELASDLLGILEPVVLRQQQERLTLRLKNLSQEERTVTIRLILPHELSTETPSITLTMSANQTDQVAFPVKNFSAIDQSTYPVFAVIEYERQGLHATSVASGAIQVGGVPQASPRRRLWPALILLLAALFLINAVAAWRRRAR